MKALDCATQLTPSTAASIKAYGYDGVLRYLGPWTKSLATGEPDIIRGAGLNLGLIWEGNPTSAGYFTNAQAKSDVSGALASLKSHGAPAGVGVVFTVDYDAVQDDLPNIVAYFAVVIDLFLGTGYKPGAYAKKSVLDALYQVFGDKLWYWQTSAWSNGETCSYAALYQHQYDLVVSGIQSDVSEVYSNPGWWGPEGGMTVLQLGSTGDAVKQLQTDLNKLLGINLTVDGQFGVATQAAVKSFQQIHGLTVDGIDGPATDAMIQKLLPPAPQPTPQPQQPTAQDIADAISLLTQAQNKLKGGN